MQKKWSCVCLRACLYFSVYTEIKGSLRRWNCVCIEAFGSFSQRLLCCHGNVCWTRVLWIFQQLLFSYDHLGYFHNPHNIQNFPRRGGGPIASKLVNVYSRFIDIGAQCCFSKTGNLMRWNTSDAWTKTPWQCMQKQTAHKCKEAKQTSCMPIRCLFTTGETEARTSYSTPIDQNDLLLFLSLSVSLQTMNIGLITRLSTNVLSFT